MLFLFVLVNITDIYLWTLKGYLKASQKDEHVNMLGFYKDYKIISCGNPLALSCPCAHYMFV